MKEFEITYFFGPSERCVVKEDVIADMAASGITLGQLLWYDVENNKKALRLMKKYGLKASIFEKRITEVAKSGRMEDVDAVVRSVVEDYKEFDNIAGWEVWDEPQISDFPMVAKLVEAFRRYAPEHETVVNLYPNYTLPQALGTEDYEDYLKQFVETVHPDFISYDHYPLLGRNLPGALGELADIEDEKERLIRIAAKREFNRKEFIENFESVRRIGLEHGLDQMMIGQLVEHGCNRNLTLPEIRWQMNLCLAYGFRRISYFTYGLPESDADVWMWDNAMIDPEGEKYQHYYDVQTVNKEIFDIGKKLFPHKSEAVFQIETGENGEAFCGYGPLQKMDGTQGVIGFFENGYVYLVNYNYLEERSFTLHAEKEILEYEKEEWISHETGWTVTLPAGGAVLLRI